MSIVLLTDCTDRLHCPTFQLLSPCKCVNETIIPDGLEIICGSNQYWDMKKTFNHISIQLKDDAKYFDAITLNMTAINEIQENVFGNLTFTVIYINAYNLTHIHKNAFNNISNIREFRFGEMEENSLNEFLSLIKHMKNLKALIIENTSINEIPDNAFKLFNENETGYEKYRQILEYINLNKNKLTKISDYAFENMPHLIEINLSENSLNYISKNLFNNINTNFSSSSNDLKIILSNNNLNGSSFEIGAFSNFSTPVDLTIGDEPSDTNNITYLDERVFQPFFDQNIRIDESGDMRHSLNMAPTLDCDHCRNKWLVQNIKKQRDYQMSKSLCSNHKKLSDSSNFKKCVH